MTEEMPVGPEDDAAKPRRSCLRLGVVGLTIVVLLYVCGGIAVGRGYFLYEMVNACGAVKGTSSFLVLLADWPDEDYWPWCGNEWEEQWRNICDEVLASHARDRAHQEWGGVAYPSPNATLQRGE